MVFPESWKRRVADFYAHDCILGKDSCTGDSGGPIILRELTDDPYVQIGIVSFSVGNECGAKNLPGVYTNIESYLDWIDSKLEI